MFLKGKAWNLGKAQKTRKCVDVSLPFFVYGEITFHNPCDGVGGWLPIHGYGKSVFTKYLTDGHSVFQPRLKPPLSDTLHRSFVATIA